jgi:hypothetical protein
MDMHYNNLMGKLVKLSTHNAVELTSQEATLYGVEYADKLPIEESGEENDHE